MTRGMPAGLAMQAIRNTRFLLAALLCVAACAGTAQASPPPGTWHQVFGDEFSGTSLDTGKWSTCRSTACTNSTELEYYTPANVTQSGGLLHLTAKHEPVSVGGKTYAYTSGMICGCGATGKSPAHFSFTYGYFEISAQVPKGQGLWPAFWSLPANNKWPPEIDAMEINGAYTNKVDMTYHWSSNRNGYATEWYTSGGDFAAGQHTFGVDWEPSAIVWYVDGVERFRYTDTRKIASEPVYLLANLAVGGDWPGNPDATTPFPSEMGVDYIRVYQH